VKGSQERPQKEVRCGPEAVNAEDAGRVLAKLAGLANGRRQLLDGRPYAL